MKKIIFFINTTIGFLLCFGIVFSAQVQVSPSSIDSTLDIVNNSVNRDYLALPIIQLNVNENVQSENVSYTGLSNFYVVNEIKYNTSTVDENGNIVNQFSDTLTLCPKIPGNFVIFATIKEGNGAVVTNGIHLSISPTVCSQLQNLANIPHKSPQVTTVKLKNYHMTVALPAV